VPESPVLPALGQQNHERIYSSFALSRQALVSPTVEISRKYAMMQALLLVLIGGTGIWFTGRHLKKTWVEARARQGKVKFSEIVFNQGLSLLWFAFLLAFFAGMIVNNLLLK
jgi:4-hydroxybenzoate polyprenyltransferase